MKKLIYESTLTSILNGVKSYVSSIFTHLNTDTATDKKNGLMSASDKAVIDSDMIRAISESSGSGLHNMIYRGKNLGSSFTDEQYTAIQNGTFENLWLGDYWVINGNNWRIACFDYLLNCGYDDPGLLSHHVVIVPDYSLYIAKMHNSDSDDAQDQTTAGGYLECDMRRKNLTEANTIINNAFGERHILKHDETLLYTELSDNSTIYTSISEKDCTVELMSEEMVFGSGILHPVSGGSSSTISRNFTYCKGRLPLFNARPDLVSGFILSSGTLIRKAYWLRDALSEKDFACVEYKGNNCAHWSTASLGVRPYFLLG